VKYDERGVRFPSSPQTTPEVVRGQSKKSKQMEGIKTWLEKNYGKHFTITEKGNDLELEPNHDVLNGCFLRDICKAVEVFGKSMLVKAELKRGIYILIW
jgi:hypothetical protein